MADKIANDVLLFCAKKYPQNLTLDKYLDTLDTIMAINAIKETSNESIATVDDYLEKINSFDFITV